MFEQYFQKGHVRRRLESNVLADRFLDLAEHLARRGHTHLTIQSYLQAAEHFGLWVRRTGRADADIDATTVRVFLTRHLPHCRCPSPHPRTLHVVRAALYQLLEVIPQSPGRGAQPAPTPVDDAVAAFEVHLRDTCGLASATRCYYVRYVRDLLSNRFGCGPVNLAALTLGDVIGFVTSRAGRMAPPSGNTVATAVRSYLRYLKLCGLGDAKWAAAVPHAAFWRLAGLPRALSDEQLQAFLAAFDRAPGTGRRDYAIALCFTALGLRVGEIAQLTLDGVDWRTGTLTLAPGKSRRVDQLPLPGQVAAALADYLRTDRPKTSSREIFVHHRAPRGQPLGTSGVRSAMRQAYHRAGFSPKLTGTHILRHTVATRLLRSGSSMKEIADLLRHRSLETSAIYAKVDLPVLASVALAWPEVQP